jgi:hypothetical protein
MFGCLNRELEEYEEEKGGTEEERREGKGGGISEKGREGGLENQKRLFSPCHFNILDQFGLSHSGLDNFYFPFLENI